LSALAVGVALGAPAWFDAAQSARLTTLVSSQRVYADAETIANRFGPRVTATPAYEHALDWAADEFRAAGVKSVAVEPFQIPRGWERGPASARIVAADFDRTTAGPREIRVEALGWTAATPGDALEADVVRLADLAPASLTAARVKGRIVFVESEKNAERGAEKTARRRSTDDVLADAGAAAILLPSRDDDFAVRPWQFGGQVSRLPIFEVERDDASVLRGLLQRGRVRMAIDSRNRTSAGPVSTRSLVAEIAGSEHPDEWVLVGAHLDSWDLAAGAQDNATGAAMVLEAARAIAAFGRPPRRSIRFALWGAEEEGFLGSTAYARAHESEMDRAVAVLNADAGTGRIIGWTAPGRDDVASAVRRTVSPLLAAVGSGDVDTSMRYAFDSDHAPFMQLGVPALDLNADDTHYEEIHHTAADTMDRVDAKNLTAGAVTVAVTAYAIADVPERIAPHRKIQRVR
jgi:hypothetical protein